MIRRTQADGVFCNGGGCDHQIGYPPARLAARRDHGGAPTVLAAMDVGIEWNEAEHGTFWPGHSFIGPEAVVHGVFARTRATCGDTFRIEIDRLLDSGSVVVMMEGRYKGIVQATGKALDAQVTHVWDIADGKIAKFQQYTDTWQWAEATGETPLT